MIKEIIQLIIVILMIGKIFLNVFVFFYSASLLNKSIHFFWKKSYWPQTFEWSRNFEM